MDSDHESTCSSATTATALGSSRSSISFTSFSSSSSSLRYGKTYQNYKPHKANQAEWESIARARSSAVDGRIGLDQFCLLRRLGSGDLGSVYLCRLREPRAAVAGCLYAMKVVDREALAFRKKLQRAETEREILRELDHPFLPTLYAEFDAAHYSCFVMEFCPGGDLHASRLRQPSRRFSVSSAKFYAAETVLALEYLHMMGVVYRDLKPENVLVRDDGHIMLSDFDLSFKCEVVPKLLRRKPEHSGDQEDTLDQHSSSCVLPMQPVLSCFYNTTPKCVKRQKPPEKKTNDNQTSQAAASAEEELVVVEPSTARSKSFVGTHEYLAPEVISGLGHGSAVDWWTLGVFLYELIYGRTPFKGENNEGTLINIIKQPLIFPRMIISGRKDCEEILAANDLISKLLLKNPKKRLGSMNGAAEIKRHEFFKGVNWALIRSVKPPEIPRDVRLLKERNRRRVIVHDLHQQQQQVVSVQKLSKKEKEEPYSNPLYVDYF